MAGVASAAAGTMVVYDAAALSVAVATTASIVTVRNLNDAWTAIQHGFELVSMTYSQSKYLMKQYRKHKVTADEVMKLGKQVVQVSKDIISTQGSPDQIAELDNEMIVDGINEKRINSANSNDTSQSSKRPRQDPSG